MGRHLTGPGRPVLGLALGLVLAGLLASSCTSAAPRPAATSRQGSGTATARPAGLPGCSAPAASAPRLTSVRTSFVLVGGVPFGVMVSPDDHRAFVSSTGQQLQAMTVGARPALSPAVPCSRRARTWRARR